MVDSGPPPAGEPTRELPQLLVLTGLSGAGRSTGAKVLEDLGFYVIDNLPPGLLRNVVDLNDLLDTPRRLAVVVDSRGGFPVTELQDAIGRSRGGRDRRHSRLSRRRG